MSGVKVSEEQVIAGQAVDIPGAPRVYDVVVHGISDLLIGLCPTRRRMAV